MPNMVPDGSMTLNADAMLASGQTLSSEALYIFGHLRSGSPLFEELNIGLKAGGLYFLEGRNGIGKCTLARLLRCSYCLVRTNTDSRCGFCSHEVAMPAGATNVGTRCC